MGEAVLNEMKDVVDWKEYLAMALENGSDTGTATADGDLLGLKSVSEIVIMGAGNLGRRIGGLIRTKGIKVASYCDNNESLRGQSIDGVEIQSIKEAAESHGDSLPFVVAIMSPGTGGYRKHRSQLTASGCRYVTHVGNLLRALFPENLPYYSLADEGYYRRNKEKYLRAIDLFDDEYSREVYARNILWLATLDERYPVSPREEVQYFPPDLIELTGDECFVDCGAFDGDTLRQFIETTNGSFDRYYALEPDQTNFRALSGYVQRLDESMKRRIEIHEMATSSSEGKLSFASTGAANAALTDGGNVEVSCTTLDKLLQGRRTTYIKMDVEGAEVATLRGARETIKAQKPAIAACIYHSPSDLWRVPVELKNLMPTSTLHVRAHEVDGFDVVAYAMP